MLKNRFDEKGFTLIELLVVVAIIGILASVVIGSLNTARTKSLDAAVKSETDAIKNEAELYYADNVSYGSAAVANAGCSSVANTFFASATSSSIINSIRGRSGAAEVYCGASTGASGAWVFSAKLPSKASYFCVDSTGKAKEIAGTTPAGVVNATTLACN